MRPSITADSPRKKAGPQRLWAVLFWLFIWEAASRAIGQEILLVSPVAVLSRLAKLALEPSFWQTILFSLTRILSGFLLALMLSILFSALSVRLRRVEELLSPLVLVMKTTPVASFVILCLIWIPSRGLSVFVSFVMVFPILYTNLLEGIRRTDPQLLEMAELFRVPFFRRVRYLYLSQVMPYLRSACTVSLGLCWKSGIAAEVIGMPSGSIGERLYESKIYLDTPDLFAWTVVVILASLLLEKAVLFLLELLLKRLERS